MWILIYEDNTALCYRDKLSALKQLYTDYLKIIEKDVYNEFTSGYIAYDLCYLLENDEIPALGRVIEGRMAE